MASYAVPSRVISNPIINHHNAVTQPGDRCRGWPNSGHQREKTQKWCSEGLARAVKVKRDAKPFVCTYCARGKMVQTSFSEGIKRSAKPLDPVHSDLCGPMPTATPAGHRYMLTLIDDHTRFTMVRLIKSKSEVTSVIKEYVARMKNRFGRSSIAFRTDNGREYLGSELSNFFNNEGIQHETTVPYTPQQSGVAERKNRSLTEMAKHAARCWPSQSLLG
ncbi:hypothetical protein M514_27523 [Trichuris suis]|uniref:Integrase catalytic domain-containing protein n=1 Tax=Trichuris suis TaxID=68888 RepID=A0A085MSV8_9BILA|nr:hypothetical protein M514_27523 [Trichuris suis]